MSPTSLIAETNLRLKFAKPTSAALALAIGLVFGTYMALADATIFRAAARPPQTLFENVPLLARVLAYVVGAIAAEVALRLVCMTAIVALLRAAGKRGDWCYWFAIGAVALIAYPLYDHAYFVALPLTPLSAAREVALHLTATTLWGWLYWRHGFLAAVTGHCSAHLALQPLLSLLA